MKKNLLAVLFDFLSDTFNGAERAFLDLLSVLVPYCVPIIPAYLTYFHTTEQMGFPEWVAGTAAFVVEVLGLTAVATAIRFWRNNLKYTKAENKAPFKLAVAVYIFYIVIVLAVNVVLEVVSGERGGWVILSIALFSLLSFPSGVLISIRVQFREMLEDREGRRLNRGGTSHQPDVVSSKRVKHASDFAPQIVAMLDEEYNRSGRVLTPKQITTKLKLPHDKAKGYVSTKTGEWKKQKGIADSSKFTI